MVQGNDRRLALGCLLVLVGLISPAAAQGRQYPPSRPSSVVSPYLDLMRRGTPTFDYYRRILPELEFRRAYQRNTQQIRWFERRFRLDGVQLRSQSGQNRRAGARVSAPNLWTGRTGPGTSRVVPGSQSTLSTTGHAVTFGDLRGYFSVPNPRR